MLCDAVRRLDPGGVARRLGDRAGRPVSRVGGRVDLAELRLNAQEARAARSSTAAAPWRMPPASRAWTPISSDGWPSSSARRAPRLRRVAAGARSAARPGPGGAPAPGTRPRPAAEPPDGQRGRAGCRRPPRRADREGRLLQPRRCTAADRGDSADTGRSLRTARHRRSLRTARHQRSLRTARQRRPLRPAPRPPSPWRRSAPSSSGSATPTTSRCWGEPGGGHAADQDRLLPARAHLPPRRVEGRGERRGAEAPGRHLRPHRRRLGGARGRRAAGLLQGGARERRGREVDISVIFRSEEVFRTVEPLVRSPAPTPRRSSA